MYVQDARSLGFKSRLSFLRLAAMLLIASCPTAEAAPVPAASLSTLMGVLQGILAAGYRPICFGSRQIPGASQEPKDFLDNGSFVLESGGLAGLGGG